MRLLLSGYGPGPTLGVWEEGRFLWTSREEGCSWLCRGGGALFGITEAEPASAVHLYRPTGDGFRRVDSCVVPGGALCHLCWLPGPGLIAGSCYGSGDLALLALAEDRLETCQILHQGGRVHCAAPSEDGAHLYTANIALDRVTVYAVETNGLREESVIPLPRGIGPRHLLPRGNSVWAVTEYSNELLRLANGRLVERFSLLPPGYSGEAYGSGLCIDGRFLYAGVRGADSVVVFRMEGESVCPAGRFFCRGHWPRALALVDEGLLACANQRSGDVVLIRLHPVTGLACGEAARIPFAGASYVGRLRDEANR